MMAVPNCIGSGCLFVSGFRTWGGRGKTILFYFIYFILFCSFKFKCVTMLTRNGWDGASLALLLKGWIFRARATFLNVICRFRLFYCFFFVWVCVSFYLFQQIINLNLLRFAGISLFRLTTFLGFVQVRMNVSSKNCSNVIKKRI